MEWKGRSDGGLMKTSEKGREIEGCICIWIRVNGRDG